MPYAKERRRPTLSERQLIDYRARLSWRKNVNGVLAFIKSIPTHPTIHGQKWREGMRDYYSKRLVSLLMDPPKGCEREAGHIRFALGINRVRSLKLRK